MAATYTAQQPWGNHSCGRCAVGSAQCPVKSIIVQDFYCYFVHCALQFDRLIPNPIAGWDGNAAVVGAFDGHLYRFLGSQLEKAIKAHEGEVWSLADSDEVTYSHTST